MEIYKAAEEFKALADSKLRVWKAYQFADGGYCLRRVFGFEGGALPDGPAYITKQRGGMRTFKTLDAVSSAVDQIGQDGFEVEFR